MKAHVGDRIVVTGARVGDSRRVGIVTELRQEDGTPPYVVRWLDSGHEALIFPGPDARVEAPARPVNEAHQDATELRPD